MYLIGLNGLKRSGKDTAALIIKSFFTEGEMECARRGFADKLKIMAAKALGLPGSDEHLIATMDQAKETWVFNVENERQDQSPWHGEGRLTDMITVREPVTHFTGRQYLQWFGQHAREVFGDSFWVDQVLPPPVEHVRGMDEADHHAANQMLLAQRYEAADALVVSDVRYPNEAQRVKQLGGVVWHINRPGLTSDGHSSEQPLPSELVDLTIDNTASIHDLGLKIEAAMETLA